MAFPIPDPSSIYRNQPRSQSANVLNTIMAIQAQKYQRGRNTLADTRYEQERATAGEKEKYQRGQIDTANKIKAINLMTKASTKKQADGYWNRIMGPDAGDPPDVTTTGDTIEIKGYKTKSGGLFDIKGPRTVIADYLDSMEKNPERADDPQASRKDMAFMARQGVNFSRHEEKEKVNKGTQLKQTIDELNALPPGSPQRKFYEGKLAKMSTPTGTKVKFNAETGEFEMTMGGPLTGESGLGKKAQGDVEKKLIDTTAQMMRLKNIEGQMEPRFLKAMPQLKNWLLAKAEWLGANLKPEQQKFVADMKRFRMAVFQNFNRYVKEITGAQMSEAEVVRLGEAVPKIADSPTQFFTAVKESLRLSRASIMRLNYIQHHGLALKGKDLEALTSLDNLPKFMDRRGEQLENEMRRTNQNLSDDEIFQTVKQQLAEEFGLVSE